MLSEDKEFLVYKFRNLHNKIDQVLHQKECSIVKDKVERCVREIYNTTSSRPLAVSVFRIFKTCSVGEAIKAVDKILNR